jgi:hypothetical protein
MTAMLGGPYIESRFDQGAKSNASAWTDWQPDRYKILYNILKTINPFLRMSTRVMDRLEGREEKEHALDVITGNFPDDLRAPLTLTSYMVHHRHCIPTYTPGHVQRMKEMQSVLQDGVWKGRLDVIGAGVSGVSVGDCVKMGREAAARAVFNEPVERTSHRL